MNAKSRTQNTLRNFSVGFGAQIFHYALSFATRTIFIMLLSVEYLGVNGLFTNVLSILSLAEMGVGGAFVSLLYKPLTEQNTEKLKSLMTAFKKAYMLIGFLVGAAGLALFPFLDVLIKETNIADINLIYIMFLAGSVSSYFYASQISFLVADQKSYIRSIYGQIFISIQYILQILALLLTRDFILYLAIQIICPILGNFLLSRKIDRLYPFLQEKGLPLDEDTRQDLKRKVWAGIYHHFGYVIVNGTDSIVISAFLGVYWVGIYSNYLLLIGVIAAFILLAFNSVTASVGHLAASSDAEKSFQVFRNLQFMNFILVGFSAVSFVTLFNPFITLWIGEQYLLDQKIVILIVIMFYIGRTGMQKTINTFKNTTGLFYKDRHYSLLEGLLNIAATVYLVQKLGLAGVFIGTIISILATRIWTEAYFVFRDLFYRPLADYFRQYLIYGLATVATGGVVYWVTMRIPHYSWLGFITMAAACGALTIGLFGLLFFKTEEFRYYYDLLAQGLRKLRKDKRPKALS